MHFLLPIFQLYKTCRRVAKMNEGNIGIFQYGLSYLQNAMTFERPEKYSTLVMNFQFFVFFQYSTVYWSSTLKKISYLAGLSLLDVAAFLSLNIVVMHFQSYKRLK